MFMCQCSSFITKEQYDKSNKILSSWINSTIVSNVLGQDLVDALNKFQMSLISKQSYLAQYIRKEIYMCANAMTTSPVESMNDLIKNKQNINSRLNLSNTVGRIITDHKTRFSDHVNKEFMQMNRTLLSSQAPTKDHIQTKCQHMIDYLHDTSHRQKCIQTNEREWLCWDFKNSQLHFDTDPFDELDYNNIKSIDMESKMPTFDEDRIISSMKIPSFLNVFHIMVTSTEGRLFMKCSCYHYERYVIINSHSIADKLYYVQTHVFFQIWFPMPALLQDYFHTS